MFRGHKGARNKNKAGVRNTPVFAYRSLFAGVTPLLPGVPVGAHVKKGMMGAPLFLMTLAALSRCAVEHASTRPPWEVAPVSSVPAGRLGKGPRAAALKRRREARWKRPDLGSALAPAFH